jgi:hypothetical protein
MGREDLNFEKKIHVGLKSNNGTFSSSKLLVDSKNVHVL